MVACREVICAAQLSAAHLTPPRGHDSRKKGGWDAMPPRRTSRRRPPPSRAATTAGASPAGRCAAAPGSRTTKLPSTAQPPRGQCAGAPSRPARRWWARPCRRPPGPGANPLRPGTLRRGWRRRPGRSDIGRAPMGGCPRGTHRRNTSSCSRAPGTRRGPAPSRRATEPGSRPPALWEGSDSQAGPGRGTPRRLRPCTAAESARILGPPPMQDRWAQAPSRRTQAFRHNRGRVNTPGRGAWRWTRTTRPRSRNQ
mmetsp:Transcript_30773/g.93069  ORF Transcript_30773/g.93069 Transcript_30773/m.93069 type:complete len:254 (+) Transcript_30773:140-901(+)